MVGIFVNYNLIASPIPVGDDAVVIGRDVPIKVVEPETLSVPSAKPEYMLRAETAAEASVLPGVIEVEMWIIAAAVVSYPLIVAGVNVRRFGMSLPVGGNAILRGRCLTSRGLGCSPRRLHSRRLRSARWSLRCGGRRAVSGNVSTAHLGPRAAMLLSAALLRESSGTKQNCKSDYLFHSNSPGVCRPQKTEKHQNKSSNRSATLKVSLFYFSNPRCHSPSCIASRNPI